MASAAGRRRRIPRGCGARSACRPPSPAAPPCQARRWRAARRHPSRTTRGVRPRSSGKALPRSAARRRLVPRRAGAEIGEDHLPAAVVDLVEQPPVAARRIFRTQHYEIGAVLHPPARVARRQHDPLDTGIGRMRGIDLAGGDAVDPHVAAGGAERFAVQERAPGADIETRDHRPSPGAASPRCAPAVPRTTGRG